MRRKLSILFPLNQAIPLAFGLCLLLASSALAQGGPRLLNWEAPVLIIVGIILLIGGFLMSFVLLYNILTNRRWQPAEAQLAGWMLFTFFLVFGTTLILWGLVGFFLFIVLWGIWLSFLILIFVLTRQLYPVFVILAILWLAILILLLIFAQ